MKHPATTRPIDNLRQTAIALFTELRVNAAGWVERLRSPLPIVESAVTIDLENVISLDDLHGLGSADHAVRLMARALEEETGADDFVARTGPTTFAVVVRGADRAVATSLVERVRARFDALLYDAGYECDLSLGEAPVSTSPEVDEMIDRSSLPTVSVVPTNAVFLN
ncbi:MAG: diguanylate cyclase domain-containing protein [Fimbriimonas sp.]